ncbi:osmoprotectant transport system permease protein [Actinomadura pelletieri DSM 43383]|uniref:Osmoprotectant transport system permease protein n=1 Tax=Actinomadura pelletieri DSM 43383 TaxID=1120940 RepID=A0A495QHL7_9ACTN|nr:ABC transporter permease subunit [Actinomadura pelletieri]RKS71655.1 osmoprotectant transport system permease protein [Actinomadura pelletieri DSM 43383]
MNDLWNQIELSWTWLTASAQWHGPDGIPHRLLQHVWYSGVSLLCAAVIGLALGLLAGHTGRGGFLAITLANVARAIPTFGLVLFVVVIDYSITPVLVALVALAVPPILVNTFEGIRGVDPDAKDAARGVGMTGWGVLWRAELPMALPLILLGLRTSAIQVVATATIAAYPGFGGLGRYIIDGLATGDYQLVVGGTVLVVGLALVVQLIFAVLRRLVVSPGLLGSARPS